MKLLFFRFFNGFARFVVDTILYLQRLFAHMRNFLSVTRVSKTWPLDWCNFGAMILLFVTTKIFVQNYVIKGPSVGWEKNFPGLFRY